MQYLYILYNVHISYLLYALYTYFILYSYNLDFICVICIMKMKNLYKLNKNITMMSKEIIISTTDIISC